MKKAVIWDLDGTLIDSYTLIVDSLYSIVKSYGSSYSKEEIYKFSKEKSVKEFIESFSKDNDNNYENIHSKYKELVSKGESSLKTTPNAIEILTTLTNSNVQNFIYTHKGTSTLDVLKALNMDKFFVEVITGQSGFKRKPEPEAIDYLVEKYSLDKKHTYYVGDRSIDVECGNNASINSVFYNEDNLSLNIATYNISNLIELEYIILQDL